MLDAVAEPPRHDARVVGKFFGDVALEPAALVLQGLRQIPMIEAEPRRHAAREQPIDQAVVEIEAALFDRAGACRQDARPRRRKAVGTKAAARQQIDIFAPAMIVIAGDIAGVAVLHQARRVAKNIPDAFAAPIRIDRALDLIARGRGAPYEVGGKGVSRGQGRTAAARNARQARRRERRICGATFSIVKNRMYRDAAIQFCDSARLRGNARREAHHSFFRLRCSGGLGAATRRPPVVEPHAPIFPCPHHAVAIRLISPASLISPRMQAAAPRRA